MICTICLQNTSEYNFENDCCGPCSTGVPPEFIGRLKILDTGLNHPVYLNSDKINIILNNILATQYTEAFTFGSYYGKELKQTAKIKVLDREMIISLDNPPSLFDVIQKELNVMRDENLPLATQYASKFEIRRVHLGTRVLGPTELQTIIPDTGHHIVGIEVKYCKTCRNNSRVIHIINRYDQFPLECPSCSM
jgi:hypothetical protein